jgi:multicomponent Na+:H+ antiporter subunit D
VDWERWLPLLLISTSLVPAAAIFLLHEEQHRTRTVLNMAGAVLKVLLVVAMLFGVAQGRVYEWRMSLLPQVDLVLRAEAIPLLFVTLSAVLWLTTTVYAIAYLEDSPRRSQFFGFFSLCVAATVGIALAGNLLTFLIFYELLTIATYPLVVHRGTPESLAGGRKYLVYLLPGGALLLVAVVWLQTIAGPVEFATGGVLDAVAETHRADLISIFVLLMVAFGIKAAIVPLHGWLPSAMIAPAPVSALLHAVAVVKAGAYGIIRVIFELYGVDLAGDLGLLTPVAIAASLTIVYGSLRALAQDELKRRLAYSTVSQLSYIVLGVSTVGVVAATGGLVHLVHQGIMKVTLFYCAGNVAETLGLHHVSELRGVGRRMPVTMAAFTIAALGMIGIPPTAGFVSKWYLGLGGIEAGHPWIVAVLIVSTVLNAAYFLPVIYSAWFHTPAADAGTRLRLGPRIAGVRLETGWGLLLPPVTTAIAVLAVGALAASPFSPLDWASRIASEIYPLQAGPP